MNTKTAKALIYLTFVLSASLACYLHPVDNLDRYVYESLIRGRSQPIAAIYQIVKHESPRAEASSVLDSAEHLGQLQPLYAIRPLYVECLMVLSRAIGPQRSITALSAGSFSLIGALLFAWSGNALLSSLILMTPAILSLGRLGTPDAFSTLIVMFGLCLLFRRKLLPATVLLLISIWVRTDNVLLTLAVLVWLAWTKQARVFYVCLLGLLAVASVAFVNHYAGNYGYLILFRYSFIAGRYPAEISATLSFAEYLRALFIGLETVLPQSSPWILLGWLAWRRLPSQSRLLSAIAAAAVLHFLLFPSPEVRYLAWAYLASAVMFVVALADRGDSGSVGQKSRETTPLAA